MRMNPLKLDLHWSASRDELPTSDKTSGASRRKLHWFPRPLRNSNLLRSPRPEQVGDFDCARRTATPMRGIVAYSLAFDFGGSRMPRLLSVRCLNASVRNGEPRT